MADSFVKIALEERIDSFNSIKVEKNIYRELDGKGVVPVELDARQLRYISSAGLRLLLRLYKSYPAMKITCVNDEVYHILTLTGFTEFLTVEKAYRVVSLENCKAIGRCAGGALYRLLPDSLLRLCRGSDPLDRIEHERKAARIALVLGIPTAISCDVVKVVDAEGSGVGFGAVYQLPDARSFSEILAEQPDQSDRCVSEFAGMLKQMHATEAPPGRLPDMKETALRQAALLQNLLPEEAGGKLLSLLREVPDGNHMLHGDFHTKNLLLQKDSVLLTDMDTLSVGHPVFDLGQIYAALIGWCESDPGQSERWQCFDFETGRQFWRRVLAAFLGTDDPQKLKAAEDRARIIGYTRLLSGSVGGIYPEADQTSLDGWTNALLQLLGSVDSCLINPFPVSDGAALSFSPEEAHCIQ